MTCKKCGELSKTRTQIVYYDGDKSSDVMLVGEAPGHAEDMVGLPFQGRAGKILNELLDRASILRN